MKTTDSFVGPEYTQQWYALWPVSLPEIERSAKLALDSSGLPQVVHCHQEGGSCRARDNYGECRVLRAGKPS